MASRATFSSKPNVFEQSLADLGKMIGAEASRPDDTIHEGPDVLWLWADFALLIEAKQGDAALDKRASGQHHNAVVWFQKNYPGVQFLRVMAAREADAHYLAQFADDTRVITPEALARLVAEIRSLVAALSEQSVRSDADIRKALSARKLTAQQLRAFTVPVARGNKKPGRKKP